MEYYMDEKWKISKEDKPSISRSVSTKAIKSASSKSSSSSLPRSSSQRCSDFSRKCKEQKAKLYIVKRCIGMLVNWKKNGDS